MNETKSLELEIEEQITAGIKKVLDGEIKDFSHNYGCLESFVRIAEELGAEHMDEREVNGCDADISDRVVWDNKDFWLSASGYYGGATIEIEEE